MGWNLRLALARLCSGLALTLAFCRRSSYDLVARILILTLQSRRSFLLRRWGRRILHHLNVRIRLGLLRRLRCLRNLILRRRNILVVIFVVRCRCFDRCLWPRSRTASGGCGCGGGRVARCFGGSLSGFLVGMKSSSPPESSPNHPRP